MEIMTDRVEIGVLPQLAEMKSIDEDWSGVSAPAARRRLQNRLNQRARRKTATFLLKSLKFLANAELRIREASAEDAWNGHSTRHDSKGGI